MTEKSNPEDKGKADEIQQEPKSEDKPSESYTREELERIIEKRLEEAKLKAEEEKKQAEELAKLNGVEKAKREFEIQTKQFEEEKSKFQREKTELEITKLLAERGLPIEFAKMLISDTAESSFENVGVFEKVWQNVIEKAVREKLKGSPIESGGTNKEDESEGIGSRLAKTKMQGRYNEEGNPYFE